MAKTSNFTFLLLLLGFSLFAYTVVGKHVDEKEKEESESASASESEELDREGDNGSDDDDNASDEAENDDVDGDDEQTDGSSGKGKKNREPPLREDCGEDCIVLDVVGPNGGPITGRCIRNPSVTDDAVAQGTCPIGCYCVMNADIE